MTDPDTIITTMSQQREQELAGDEAHYKLRKACQARAVELYFALKHETGHAIPHSPVQTYAQVDQLLKEIDDAR